MVPEIGWVDMIGCHFYCVYCWFSI